MGLAGDVKVPFLLCPDLDGAHGRPSCPSLSLPNDSTFLEFSGTFLSGIFQECIVYDLKVDTFEIRIFDFLDID